MVALTENTAQEFLCAQTKSLGLDLTGCVCSSCQDGIRRGRPRADTVRELISEGETSSSRIRCNICNRVFPREKSLQAHKRTHTGGGAWQCAGFLSGRQVAWKTGFRKKMPSPIRGRGHVNTCRTRCKNTPLNREGKGVFSLGQQTVTDPPPPEFPGFSVDIWMQSSIWVTLCNSNCISTTSSSSFQVSDPTCATSQTAARRLSRAGSWRRTRGYTQERNPLSAQRKVGQKCGFMWGTLLWCCAGKNKSTAFTTWESEVLSNDCLWVWLNVALNCLSAMGRIWKVPDKHKCVSRESQLAFKHSNKPQIAHLSSPF